ncbi:MAG: ADP-ribosylglycohydrolase family protein [Bacteroidales bacterium]|nr:ADP-ribosylglycohydrolase family protein [Bacteroidales bacterium]
MKRVTLLCGLAAVAISFASCTRNMEMPEQVTMAKATLQDKIRGAWAGQIIGCTYGGPTEFSYVFFMNDKIPLEWNEGSIKHYFDRSPGLYDDVYMDLTFVDVFDKEGLDAPVESFAKAFAEAGYPLWHANAQARYNILQGIMPPESGNWRNNPHAEDLDFQIEADYAGIMSPGMVNQASHFCDGIGHMMNSGDGYYGGVYMAAMYSLAFVCDDMEFVCREALKTIPEQSLYHKAMADVIRWHSEYPDDWHQCWFEVNKEYNYDIGCPEGVQTGFDIDALLNSAYVVIGLLYGDKDFCKTIDIATRCGADSDCNPASAGGILGAMLGYSGIDEVWKKPLEIVADRNFAYTDISFNKAVELSEKQAWQVIERAGGKVSDSDVTIKVEVPQAVPFEENFTGHFPGKIHFVRDILANVDSVCFDGIGVVARYDFITTTGFNDPDYVAEVEVYLDGQLDKTVILPYRKGKSPEFYYKYEMPDGHHKLAFNWLNRKDGIDIRISRVLTYIKKD